MHNFNYGITLVQVIIALEGFVLLQFPEGIFDFNEVRKWIEKGAWISRPLSLVTFIFSKINQSPPLSS
jgi:hypothetical protein